MNVFKRINGKTEPAAPDSNVSKDKVTLIHSPMAVLGDAISIIARDMSRLSTKSVTEEIAWQDAKKLDIFIKSIVSIAKEQRESEQLDKLTERLESMSAKELKEFAMEELDKLQTNIRQ